MPRGSGAQSTEGVDRISPSAILLVLLIRDLDNHVYLPRFVPRESEVLITDLLPWFSEYERQSVLASEALHSWNTLQLTLSTWNAILRLHWFTEVACGKAPPALRLEEAHLPFAFICTPTSSRGTSLPAVFSSHLHASHSNGNHMCAWSYDQRENTMR